MCVFVTPILMSRLSPSVSGGLFFALLWLLIIAFYGGVQSGAFTVAIEDVQSVENPNTRYVRLAAVWLLSALWVSAAGLGWGMSLARRSKKDRPAKRR